MKIQIILRLSNFYDLPKISLDLKTVNAQPDQGLVVQSMVSLTISFRGRLVKCFMTLLPNTLIFFVEKMRAASHIFSTKTIGKFKILTFEILTYH